MFLITRILDVHADAIRRVEEPLCAIIGHGWRETPRSGKCRRWWLPDLLKQKVVIGDPYSWGYTSLRAGAWSTEWNLLKTDAIGHLRCSIGKIETLQDDDEQESCAQSSVRDE